jgi:hypothetical protein
MITNMTRFKTLMLCLIIIFAVMLAAIAIQQETIHELKQLPATIATKPEIVDGEFTLFHYTRAGWINHFYISKYRLDGQVLYYSVGDNKQLIPIQFDEICIVPGWVEEEDLSTYGYWIPDDLGLYE